jgi:hypothetical protein
MQDTVYLVVLSAFMLAGEIAMPGEVVEVTNSEARDLLGRNLARVATEEDQPDVEPDATDEAEPTGKAKK